MDASKQLAATISETLPNVSANSASFVSHRKSRPATAHPRLGDRAPFQDRLGIVAKDLVGKRGQSPNAPEMATRSLTPSSAEGKQQIAASRDKFRHLGSPMSPQSAQTPPDEERLQIDLASALVRIAELEKEIQALKISQNKS